MKNIFLSLAVLFSVSGWAIDPIKIEIGKSYQGYSNEELRRRVWDLERAVAQLQSQVFQLAYRDGSGTIGSAPPMGGNWSCHMESFGKTHVAAGNTKASALAQVLKKCSDATNAVHCHE